MSFTASRDHARVRRLTRQLRIAHWATVITAAVFTAVSVVNFAVLGAPLPLAIAGVTLSVFVAAAAHIIARESANDILIAVID